MILKTRKNIAVDATLVVSPYDLNLWEVLRKMQWKIHWKSEDPGLISAINTLRMSTFSFRKVGMLRELFVSEGG